MTFTHMCVNFSTAVLTTHHFPINRGEVMAHRMGRVRKRGIERREAGLVPTGLTHGSVFTTKTPASGHGTPEGGADACTNTHEYKYMQLQHTQTHTQAIF